MQTDVSQLTVTRIANNVCLLLRLKMSFLYNVVIVCVLVWLHWGSCCYSAYFLASYTAMERKYIVTFQPSLCSLLRFFNLTLCKNRK
jgi:hypothetical protein